MSINYRQGGDDLHRAWLAYADTRPGEKLSLVDFAAGWNAARATSPLREMMIREIYYEYELDYVYARIENAPDYREYLRSLSDEDFMLTYNQIQRTCNRRK